jgi:hypothetical protein
MRRNVEDAVECAAALERAGVLQALCLDENARAELLVQQRKLDDKKASTGKKSEVE